MTKDKNLVMSGHRPTRYFRTWMGFKSQGGGQWVAKYRGETFTIERRRSEPGYPYGWYYFGPGHPDGRCAGDYPEDAAALAMECADRFTKAAE